MKIKKTIGLNIFFFIFVFSFLTELRGELQNLEDPQFVPIYELRYLIKGEKEKIE